MRQRFSRKGFALATLLLFIPVLVIMMGGLLITVMGQTDQTRLTYEQTAALYLAEAAIVDATNQLENDPTWNAGFTKKRLPGVEGFYTVKFHTTGPFTSFESVNNLDGTQPDNYRGAGFVPGGAVSIVSTATVGRQTRVVEALVKLGGGLLPVDLPVLTTGAVSLAGNVTVNGVKGQSDPTPINASVHSNFADPGADLVKWDGNGIATFTGKVSSVGANANAVNLGASPIIGAGVPAAGQARVAQSIDTAAAAKSVPRVNIVAKVSSKSALPPVTVPTLGNLNLSSGDRFINASSVVQGDLVLNGTNLYVQGDLKVNGTVKGDGSLYVTGKTEFQGDSSVRSSSPEKVALYSHGSVVLSGLKGSEYLDTLAATNPTFSAALSSSKVAIQDFQSQVAGWNPSVSMSPNNILDQIRSELGLPLSSTPRAGHSANNLATMKSILLAQPASSTRQLVLSRVTEMKDIFDPSSGASEAAALAALSQGRLITGGVDAIIDNDKRSSLPVLGSYLNSINYNKLGSSSFQGLVYTNGAFVSNNEVDIRGAVVVDDDGSQSDLVVVPPSGPNQIYKAGSLNLLNDSTLTYVEDFFKSAGPTGGPGSSKVILWMGR